MLQSVLFTLLLVTLANGQSVHYVRIGHGEPYYIKNPGYPEKEIPLGTYTEWNLIVEANSTIKVFCDDIRMGQNEPWTPECKEVYLSFKEGDVEKKICGSNLALFQYLSKGPKLSVKFEAIEGDGFVKCLAYNAGEPEPQYIDLQINGRIQTIGTPKTIAPNFDNVWILRSEPGTRISLQCNLALENFETCYKDVMTVDTGDEVEILCGHKEVTLFTKSNRGKVRIQMGEFGDLRASCLVQAVTGSHANQFLNVISEEVDSSEFGITRGRRNTSCECGRRHASPGRITNGKETKENEFPWMVLLNAFTDLGNGMMSVSYCGGTVITRRHVLTAAHCIVNQNKPVSPQDVHVRLAEHHSRKSSGKEQLVKGKELFVHELYLQKGTPDIGIIFTDKTIEFNDFIGPICLTRESNPLINRRIHIMGWGRTENGTGSDVLLKSKATVMDNSLCSIADYEICTHGVSSTTCFGDSGGPLVILDPDTNRFTQMALVSRVSNSECKNGFAMHTHVPSFYDWIQNIVKKSDSTEATCQKI